MAPRAPSKKEKEKEKESTPKRSPSILSVASNTALSSISEGGKDVTPSPLKPKNEDSKVKKSKSTAGAEKKAGKARGEKVEKGLVAQEGMEVLEGGSGVGNEQVEGMGTATASGSLVGTATDPLKPNTTDANCKIKKSKPAAEKSKATKSKIEKGLVASEKSEKAKAVKAGKEGKEKKDTGGGSIGKEKAEKGKEKVSGEEAERLILQYLKEQNRPYSATEVSANLHGKVTKTLADKLLKEMEQDGRLAAKATNGDKKGSQWVFWYPQDPTSTATPQELITYESTIQTLTTTTIPPLKSTLKTLTSTLSTILSTPSTPALAIHVEELRTSIEEKSVRLRGLKGESGEGGGSGKAVKKEEAEKVEREWRFWKDALGRRKRCWKEVEGLLLEGMGREELWERVGIEGGEGEGDELWFK